MTEPEVLATTKVLPTTKLPADLGLEGVRAVARLMDTAFVVPGTKIRFGMDAVIGLIPGVGDAISSLIGLFIIGTAARLGVPRPVLVRMMLNQGVDAATGLVPVVGDVADIAFKAHRRNVALLEQALADPPAARRVSWLAIAGLAGVLFAFLAGAVAGGIYLAKWLFG